LKIPKGYSESVNKRRTDTTIAKRKRRNNDPQTLHRKTKIEQYEPQLKTRMNSGSPEG
jgi:hypothetical protein